MHIVYSEDHKLRNSQTELYGGELVSPFERPERMDYIIGEFNRRNYNNIVEPTAFDLAPVLDVHEEHYVKFLSNAVKRWEEAGFKGEAIPNIWPGRSTRSNIIPDHIEAQLGYYCLASETSISHGTYEAALSSKNVVLSAADKVLDGERSAFALCRPPGHHASVDQYGGYCFFNNAAIAAQRALNNGAKRVAILDVDFHHGNGTQQIFYDRDDVLTISLHGDPHEAFPYFLGFADESGSGAGEGYNVNYPMPSGTNYETWSTALNDAFGKIRNYNSDYLIVSLGVDTFENDPISFFKLKSADFSHYGQKIAKLDLPTLFVMEGGYAVEEIGVNTVNVIDGFSNGTS
jgi:acetoin utilization deacetylase AcuC-like enzyme